MASNFPSMIARHGDKWFFFVLFLIGCATIVTLDFIHVSKFAAVTVCIVLLLVYALFTSVIPALRLRPDQAADNSYYLGLLYTLTSLGVALFRFSSDDVAADAILRNFGIAIATTIFGLGLRVFLSQFREDPDDLEFESRAALAETVRKLRGTLDVSIAEMQGFASGARQAMSEVQEAANKSTLDTLSGAVSRFSDAAEDMSRRFEATTSAFEKRVTAFDASVAQVADAVDGLSNRIGSVRADPTLLQEGLQPTFDELSDRMASFARSFEADQQKISYGMNAVAKLGQTLDAFHSSAETISRAAASLGTATSALDEGATAFQRLDDASKGAAAAAAAYRDHVGHLIEGQATQQQAVLDRLDAASRELQLRTEGSLSQIDRSAAAVAASIASLNAEFSGSGEAVQKVRRELAELAGWIIQRLDER